jgi:purine-binding chemotaxis protein CheW
MTTESHTGPVLLVEDSAADRARLEPLLPEGVTVVLDAEAALKAVRRQSFAVILIAQELAGGSGLDVLRELRANGDRTPVILMTTDKQAGVAEAALRAGAAGCLVKETGFEARVPALLARTTAKRSHRTPRSGGVLVFELGGHPHGLFTEDVELVSQAVAITPLPGAPPGVEGLVDVQGDLVPVLDLRALLGLAAKELDPDEHLVVTRAGARRVAIRVDRAAVLAHVDAAQIETGSPLTGGVTVARLDDELVPIHDPSSFLPESTWSGLATRRKAREGNG